ncbi:Gfo/Idh/MocA family protein [Actinacidiphila epipremni]|uniref:Gfo/Idh/MocA family oxidoreductase n=1 Tax=Actinacidiphila epipremni TaxID=2053013 RepID=A0ABX0ZQW3_9ACTN|nr:Gfo/Idh/MocA family oxidoreductase [Actinacidiphila epipremni]NJP46338.1 Gfo/Idh/MocA family oxidoreductase [Actinacidiphila epipremni]
MEEISVVLAGANGHGRWHLENLRRLVPRGAVRLVGVCDVEPPGDEVTAGLGAPDFDRDLGALIDRTAARVAIVCTPIHTHTPLALAAARHGAHVLLEKPPAPSWARFEELADGMDAAGRACQVGFQSFGSHAVAAVRTLVEDGAIGEVRGIGAAGNWVREEHYFTRSAWSGRRRLGGADVVDGVLTNPLAHAVATALRIDRSDRSQDVVAIETQLLRAHDIEADDTSCVRIRTARGTVITVAATLCARQAAEPYVVVHGTRGRITFWYKQDRVLVQRAGHGPDEQLFGRTDLLENLLDHVADRAELIAPLSATGAFTKVVEAVRTAPEPSAVPDRWWQSVPGRHSPRRVIDGVDSAVEAAAGSLQLFTELDVPWAVAAAGRVRSR